MTTYTHSRDSSIIQMPPRPFFFFYISKCALHFRLLAVECLVYCGILGTERVAQKSEAKSTRPRHVCMPAEGYLLIPIESSCFRRIPTSPNWASANQPTNQINQPLSFLKTKKTTASFGIFGLLGGYVPCTTFMNKRGGRLD